MAAHPGHDAGLLQQVLEGAALPVPLRPDPFAAHPEPDAQWPLHATTCQSQADGLLRGQRAAYGAHVEWAGRIPVQHELVIVG